MTKYASTPRLFGRFLAWFFAVILVFCAALSLAGWIGSSIPRNSDWQPPQQGDEGVTIMIETNGTHTGLVVPVVTPLKDWRETFPSGYGLINGEEITHLAIGWGERDVFLNVRTWDDLSPLTVARILTTGGDSVLRVNHYLRPAPSNSHRPLRISSGQYLALIRQIEAKLPDLPAGESRMAMRGTEIGAVYFAANGRYTALNTCNSWTGDALAASGVKVGWWTPFAGGVMKWITPPE